MSDFTNFDAYSHGDLRKMVQSMDSGGVMSASDPWRRTADCLKQIRTTLQTASGDATSSWEGTSSDAFYSKMTKLANTVNNVSAYANDAAITMKMMSEAIDQAKRDMPEEPSFLDKVGDAIGDTAETAVGVDNENTRTTITDERKAKAVAVMETLATKYRTAAQVLKPPNTVSVENIDQLNPPDDPSGATAIGALIMGGGMGLAANGGGARNVEMSTTSRSVSGGSQRAPLPPKQGVAPTDPGIKGGTANPVPRPAPPGGGGSVGVGPTPGPGAGTGIDSVITGPKPTTGTGAPGFGTETGGPGEGGSRFGGGVFGSGNSGSTGSLGSRGGLAGGGGRPGSFGSGGLGGLAAGEGTAGAGGRAGAGGAGRSGGVAGESGHGAASRKSFTEGGSGLGKSRAGQAGQGGAGQRGKDGQHGMPGGSQAGKKDKDKKKDGKRPDYLVEDEETWMTGQRANPNVVD
ncbi:hypothetical protein CFP65_2647 [Kitasatospora sp. MMS16-BH015]|uniref:WXG100 family type VII secretion target n=1 Tax=Kitasatospora sp. MMS16-BH015 TaxID=2018025 RepID=UPI000CA3AF7C|nr:WXG100 family type VII secretion target [Kitasatospora sp. MMS16-BH015]AUG77469.1 hypothetical protein CFP65_2647 [Kitasatospora sp. MMS16-BH015]